MGTMDLLVCSIYSIYIYIYKEEDKFPLTITRDSLDLYIFFKIKKSIHQSFNVSIKSKEI